MNYRLCKTFEVESGHMLSKHPGRCRFPHGHTRRIEIVVARPTLDANDMICDFAAIKAAVADFIDQFDHSLALHADDPILPRLDPALRERVVIFQGEDPTTEVMARRIYEHMADTIRRGQEIRAKDGRTFRLPADLTVERVRVWETSSSWAEFGL
jgi:6-pyruvoyltetrahydropterin/6-carboxytetrahydropterin synthase